MADIAEQGVSLSAIGPSRVISDVVEMPDGRGGGGGVELPSLDALRAEVDGLPLGEDASYLAKQVHPIPPFNVVDRAKVIWELTKGEVVLDIGGSGPLHDGIVKVAKRVYTVDKTVSPDDGDAFALDLDDVHTGVDHGLAGELKRRDPVTLVVCGEVLEHLANPGHFLETLRRGFPDVPKVFSVPNALTESGVTWARRGIENVNIDHVAYYSWRTLRTLFDRYGYTVATWAWYHGLPNTAEGLIAVTD